MIRYPYIPDKKMYAAVMAACKYIRDTGYFHKAVRYYANKYGVDEDELEKHIRARQGAGQRKPRASYYYFVVVELVDYAYSDDSGSFASWEWGDDEFRKHTHSEIIKATSTDNARKQVTKNNPDIGRSGEWVSPRKIYEFKTKDEAEAFEIKLKWDDIKEYVLRW